MTLHPPTAHLPPIGKISSQSPQVLLDALKYLRVIYNPEVRGSRRRRNGQPTPAAHLSMGNLEPFYGSDLDLLRADAFERSYSIRWLTTLISQAQFQQTGDLSSLPTAEHHISQEERVIREASCLLATCAGTASAGTITRVFTFDSAHTHSAIRIQVTDAPLENQDFTSVGAQTWGGACVLSETIVDQPEDFGIIVRGGSVVTSDIIETPCPTDNEFRVLELGAGTGMASLTLGKLFESLSGKPTKKTAIVATDFHPSVLANLRANVVSNFPPTEDLIPPSQASPVSVTTHFLDWSAFPKTEEQVPPFQKPFDLVIGSDIIYEAQHAVWIKTCLTRLLRRPEKVHNPNSGSACVFRPLFHLIIPLRPTHASESNTVEQVFPTLADTEAHKPALVIFSKEIIVCEANGDVHDRGNGDDVEYAYYKIGWS